MLDLITVVFRPEIPYLKIQARSVEKYFAPDQVDTIFVVVNDDTAVCDLIDKSWYGNLAHKVVVYPYTDFGYINRVGGWDNQQLCKILAAARSQCDWSVVLDAKTFFVKNFKESFFFDQDKRACTASQNPLPVFESARTFVQNFYNIELDQIVGPAGVPFLFHTATVQYMLQDSEQLSGKKFIDFFLDNVCYPNLITEFYLYSGYVRYKYETINSLYNGLQNWDCVNIAEWETDNFDTLFSKMQKFRALTVSIAAKAWAILDDTQKTAYLEFLQQRGIITDVQNTQKELNTVIN